MSLRGHSRIEVRKRFHMYQHAYRRSWAPSRKKLPVVDVAAAGGWSAVSTRLNCYQQADKETLLEVMSHSRKIRDEAKTQ
jgi:hypothetical protein